MYQQSTASEPSIYRQALNLGLQRREQVPISSALVPQKINEKILLDGLAIQGNNPLQFRRFEQEITDILQSLKGKYRDDSVSAAIQFSELFDYLNLLKRLFDIDITKYDKLRLKI